MLSSPPNSLRIKRQRPSLNLHVQPEVEDDLYGLDSDGKSLLHNAIEAHSVPNIENFLENGFKVNQLDARGNSGIHFALLKNDKVIAQLLKDRGANIDIKNKKGERPILIAFKMKNFEFLDWLFSQGVSLEDEFLYDYLQGNNIIISTPRSENISNYKNIIKELLKNENLHETMVYTYSLFCTDKELFNALIAIAKQQYEGQNWQENIRHLMREFALEAFPLGHPSKDVMRKIKELLDIITLDDIELNNNYLRWKTWESIEKIYRQKAARNYNIPKRAFIFMDSEWTPLQIAEGLTGLSETLLKNITFKELVAWLKNEHRGHNVQVMGMYSRRITNYFSYLIASEHDSEKRRLVIKKIYKIAKNLYKIQNFWSLAQLVQVLSREGIRRLIYSKKINKEVEKWQEVISFKHNFYNYRRNLLTYQSKCDVFPNLDVIFGDLKRIFEERPKVQPKGTRLSMSEEQDEIKWLKEIGALFKILKVHKKQSSMIDQAHYFLEASFFHVPHIPEEVTAELSHMQEPWALYKIRTNCYTSKKLENWDCHDLVLYLIDNDLQGCLFFMFKAQLWDGKALYEISHKEKTTQILEDNGIPSSCAEKLKEVIDKARDAS